MSDLVEIQVNNHRNFRQDKVQSILLLEGKFMRESGILLVSQKFMEYDDLET